MIFKRKYAAALAAALMVTTAGITAQAFDADTGIVVPVYGLDDSGVHLYDAHIIANDIQTVMNGEDMELGTLNVNKLTIQGQEIASSDDITNIKEDITNLQDAKVDNSTLEQVIKNQNDNLQGVQQNIEKNLQGVQEQLGGQIDKTNQKVGTIDGELQQEKIDRAEGDQAVLNVAAENDKKVLEAAVANDKAIQEQLGGQIDKANQKIDTVDGELQQEKIDRAEEDQKLHGRIDQETADRIAADNALSGRIDGLDNRIDDLSGEVDEVGAISAALAGLHPLDYDGTGSKFHLSAAMGGFYHFNEDVMLSLGGATTFSGEHKTAANLGVTFRVGQGGRKEKQASADVAAQLEAMQAQMQAMQEKIAALEAEKAAPAPEAAPAEETEVPAPSASYMDSLSRAAK